MKTESFKLLTTSNILKERRINLRLTQQEVAEKAKILPQQYQKFESGRAARCADKASDYLCIS